MGRPWQDMRCVFVAGDKARMPTYSRFRVQKGPCSYGWALEHVLPRTGCMASAMHILCRNSSTTNSQSFGDLHVLLTSRRGCIPGCIWMEGSRIKPAASYLTQVGVSGRKVSIIQSIISCEIVFPGNHTTALFFTDLLAHRVRTRASRVVKTKIY